MRRRILLSALAMAPVARAAEPRPVMRVSTLPEVDPASTTAETIVTEAYRRLGITMQLERMPAERSLLSANNGEVDGELFRRLGIEQQYPNLIRVPVPLMTYEIVAFAKSGGTRPRFKDWQGLQPYTFSYVRGVKIIEQFTGGMQGQPVTTAVQAFAMLDRGRVDLVLANRSSGLAALLALGLSGVEVLDPPLASFPVFHFVHKKHERLVPGLTGVLQQLEREGFAAMPRP